MKWQETMKLNGLDRKTRIEVIEMTSAWGKLTETNELLFAKMCVTANTYLPT